MRAKRMPFICGNFKLNLYLSEVERETRSVASGIVNMRGMEVAIAPVATTLFMACQRAQGTSLKVAAQNVFYEAKGAFTGEWSVQHLLELGCSYAIVGHSERRQYFFESDSSVAAKVKACLAGGLAPIACVGETLTEREAGQVNDVLTRQLEAIIVSVTPENLALLVLAYEPVWAIGTGVNASPEQAQEVHGFIRGMLRQNFGDVAEQVRILYGGSVKPENTFELLQNPDIDGALVGGASLQADSFLAIIDGARRAKRVE